MKLTEEEIRVQQTNITQLGVKLLNRCEEWVNDQIRLGRPIDVVMGEAVTAALQVGLVMAARLGLPREILHSMYDGIQDEVKPPDASKAVGKGAPSDTPDPKSN